MGYNRYYKRVRQAYANPKCTTGTNTTATNPTENFVVSVGRSSGKAVKAQTPINAFDGITTGKNRCCLYKGAYFTVNFNKQVEINTIDFLFGGQYTDYVPERTPMQVYSSQNGSDYSSISGTYRLVSENKAPRLFRFTPSSPITCKYLRLQVPSNNYEDPDFLEVTLKGYSFTVQEITEQEYKANEGNPDYWVVSGIIPHVVVGSTHTNDSTAKTLGVRSVRVHRGGSSYPFYCIAKLSKDEYELITEELPWEQPVYSDSSQDKFSSTLWDVSKLAVVVSSIYNTTQYSPFYLFNNLYAVGQYSRGVIWESAFARSASITVTSPIPLKLKSVTLDGRVELASRNPKSITVYGLKRLEPNNKTLLVSEYSLDKDRLMHEVSIPLQKRDYYDGYTYSLSDGNMVIEVANIYMDATYLHSYYRKKQ